MEPHTRFLPGTRDRSLCLRLRDEVGVLGLDVESFQGPLDTCPKLCATERRVIHESYRRRV